MVPVSDVTVQSTLYARHRLTRRLRTLHQRLERRRVSPTMDLQLHNVVSEV